MNVILMALLSRLRVDLFHMQKTNLVVHTFDETKKEVIGNMELPSKLAHAYLTLISKS